MKKILLALLMALPCLGLSQVATQKVSNTAVIYDSRSPVTFGTNFTGLGANYLLNSQTLTGNGSIITRSLGDARYAALANGFDTNSSYIYATGTTQSFYNITVRNDARVFGSTITSNILALGTLRVSNSVNFIQTGVTWAFDGTRMGMGTNNGGVFAYEVRLTPDPLNPNYVQIGNIGSGSGTTVSFEGSGNVQTVIDANNNSAGENQYFIRKDATNGPILYAINESFNATNYGNLTVTNTLTVGQNLGVTNNISAFGTNNILPNQTLVNTSNILTGVLGDKRYWRPMTHTFGTVTGAVNKANFDMRNPAGNSTDQIQFCAFSNMVLRTVSIFIGGIDSGLSGASNYSLQVFRQTTTGGGGYIMTWTPCDYYRQRTANNSASAVWKLNLTDANVNACDIQYEIRANGATNNANIAIGGSATWFIQE